MSSIYFRESLPIDPDNLVMDRWPHLKGLPITHAHAEEVMLLTGQDCPDVLLPFTTVQGRRWQLYAMKTCLGWTVNGPVTSHKGAASAKAFFSQRKREPSPVNNLGRRMSVKCQCNVTSMLNWCWADICRSRLFTGRTATLEGRTVLVSGIKWVLQWRKEYHSARQGDLGEVADVSHVWEGPLQATNLIFLDQQPRLHDNQEMAMKRLASLDRKL